MLMDIMVNNLCQDINNKLNNNLGYFEEMLRTTQLLEATSPDEDVELYNRILEQRQDLINKIEEVNQEILQIQNKISFRIKIEKFTYLSIQPYITKDLYDNTTNLYIIIQNIIQQIQNMDKEINQKAEITKEATKLQLLRARSILKRKLSYQKNHALEPRFIDKRK